MNGTISSLALQTHLVVPDLDRESDREDRSRNQVKGIAKKNTRRLFAPGSTLKHFNDKCAHLTASLGKGLGIFYLYQSLIGLAVFVTIMHFYPALGANGNDAYRSMPRPLSLISIHTPYRDFGGVPKNKVTAVLLLTLSKSRFS